MKKTELILNDDGSVYHLHLKPDEVAKNIIVVGDPGRVDLIAPLLDKVTTERQNREFRTVAGVYEGSEVMIISSGIGTDNIDIVLNELDALVNIDMESLMPVKHPVTLNIVRLGTSGSLQEDIPAGATVLTHTAIGFDGLLHFYEEYDHLLDPLLSDALVYHTEWPDNLPYPYAVKASREMLDIFCDSSFIRGITISAPGFYAPQGRTLRLRPFDDEINEKLKSFNMQGRKISNYEMESSAIYGLGQLLEHKTITLCVVIGNRVTGQFISDYNPLVKELAIKILDKLPFGEVDL